MVEISIKESKKRAIILPFVSIIMVCACLLNLIIDVYEMSYLGITIGLIGTLTFGFCTIFAIKRCYKTFFSDTGVVLLKLDNEGIHDRSSAFSTGLIKWDEVKSVRIEEMVVHKFIGIEVKNLNQYMSRISPVQQLVAKANIKLGFPPINITLDTSKIKLEDVVEAIKSGLNNIDNIGQTVTLDSTK